jgi:hypothetical protein
VFKEGTRGRPADCERFAWFASLVEGSRLDREAEVLAFKTSEHEPAGIFLPRLRKLNDVRSDDFCQRVRSIDEIQFMHHGFVTVRMRLTSSGSKSRVLQDSVDCHATRQAAAPPAD